MELGDDVRKLYPAYGGPVELSGLEADSGTIVGRFSADTGLLEQIPPSDARDLLGLTELATMEVAEAFEAIAPTSGGDRGVIASDGAGGWVFVSTQSWPDGAFVVIDSGETGGLTYSETGGSGASMAAVLARGLGA